MVEKNSTNGFFFRTYNYTGNNVAIEANTSFSIMHILTLAIGYYLPTTRLACCTIVVLLGEARTPDWRGECRNSTVNVLCQLELHRRHLCTVQPPDSIRAEGCRKSVMPYTVLPSATKMQKKESSVQCVCAAKTVAGTQVGE